ncbi:synaptopodin 2-like protein [Syngnathoides biaculeatus]|uniref:synaptopodin 2-like protein n=1 Tax=Syngnathoides biaculeatus TaxID=300417 RepID=UPI002ADDDBCD|nr:synaptopodin 2-like protein [Syngnathoides biaculeatus]XP_061690272.1 synaptopodin 2-like protein [Syngnathoides biaculeatus]XP_061690273.1 synaptopodin 2-like protein [Syngnathoides biaculeatus]
MEKGHTSLCRGMSWSPRGLTKPIQAAQASSVEECNATHETTGLNTDQTGSKTNLTRSVSLSEKELKEARLRSHIIAAQLTVPSSSSSRGVQLFNRRKQRVSAFTLESSGGQSKEDIIRNVKPNLSCSKPTWADRSREEKERDLNDNNCTSSPLFVPPGRIKATGDSMEEQSDLYSKEDVTEHSVIQERHFLPVKEIDEEEEEKDTVHKELEDKFKDELPPERENTNPVAMSLIESETSVNRGHMVPSPLEKIPNGCHGPLMISVSTSKQTTIINRTARPFFSPVTVQSQEANSPVMDSLPTCSAFTAPQPVAVSSPPPPTYPTPPLPAFPNKPLTTDYFSSTVTSPTFPPPLPTCAVSHNPASPLPQYGPPTTSKPSTFLPQPFVERKSTPPIKTGLLDDSATKRQNKKSMFTFKEKKVVPPNPELLSLVQGVDEKKKHRQRSVPEPTSEEELLALGAEASNFLAKEEYRTEEAKAPEWASCLKSSRTYPRVEHKPEQTLNDATGKGAELFAKRRSRMEKYVVENQNAGHHIRAPSPTMSLPPSWVYPSNMPGRVKAIAKNSDMCAQLAQNMKAQQTAKPKPRQTAPAAQAQETPALENGCSKIEMDLSRHRPYQLNSSLFILKPVKDPLSTLPKGAPQSKNQMPPQDPQSFSRQTSLPNSASLFRTQYQSPQLPLSSITRVEYPSSPALGQASTTVTPTCVSSSRPGIQAPRPRFSAKQAGIEAQKPESSAIKPPSETQLGLTRKFSSPDCLASTTWTSGFQTKYPSANISSRSVTSPVSFSRVARCQSPMGNQNIQLSAVSSASITSPPQSSTSTSQCTPPWGSRSHSPLVSQNIPSSTHSSGHDFRFQTSNSSRSLPWSSRCQSPVVNLQSSNASQISSKGSTNTSPLSPPWGSKSQSPIVSTSTEHSSLFSRSSSRPFQTSTTVPHRSPPWSPRCQSPVVIQTVHPSTSSSSKLSKTSTITSPVSPLCGSRSQSPALSHSSLSFPSAHRLSISSASSPVPLPRDSRCMSPNNNNFDSKANHRMLAKNIINAAKRKNSPSPGALSGHSLPISPVGYSPYGYDCQKFQSQPLGGLSPTFTSPSQTPTDRICSPVRLYNTRSLTDSDASIESEDSGLRSPGTHSYNTCPRVWGGSLRVKKSTISTDL